MYRLWESTGSRWRVPIPSCDVPLAKPSNNCRSVMSFNEGHLKVILHRANHQVNTELDKIFYIIKNSWGYMNWTIKLAFLSKIMTCKHWNTFDLSITRRKCHLFFLKCDFLYCSAYCYFYFNPMILIYLVLVIIFAFIFSILFSCAACVKIKIIKTQMFEYSAIIPIIQ